MRVSGVPANTATSLAAGTAADTVIWYQGEDSADPARQSALARIDDNFISGSHLSVRRSASLLHPEKTACFVKDERLQLRFIGFESR